MQQLVIHVADLARALAVSEAAIRSHISRRNWPRAIPVPIRIGRRWAWVRRDVESWLCALAGEDFQPEQKKSGPGRPKKEEQVLGR